MSAIKPYKSMPCTVCHPHDRYAAEVVWVSPTGHRIKIVRRAPGFGGEKELATRREDGSYRLAGKHGARIALGKAEDYRCQEI